ncbi:hypothetical protein ZWY2020_018033 [Hordeum vulgare]|nr:hypothetical protein ZWY2020_018033 [Hordeum vulgare]
MNIGSSSDDYQLTDEESTGGFDVYPTHHMDEDEDSESEEDRCGKRKGSQNPINSRSSIKKMKGLVDRLCEQKRCLVREMGFEGLLHLPVVTRSNRKQSMWLMSKIDEKASAMVIDARRDLPFNDGDVGKVLGVPSVGSPIARNVLPHVGDVVRRILGINIGLHKITPIMRIVELKYRIPMTKDESRQFKVAFAICAMTFLLAPPLKHNYFTTDYWNALHMPDLIQMFNWGRYIREQLLSSAGRVKSELLGGKLKSNLSGCTFFLQVFYLDNLDREEKNVAHNVFPRCKEYNQKTIAEIIDEDTSTGKNAEIVVYGHLLPRKPGTVCYSRNKSARQDIDNMRLFAGIIINKVEQFSNKCQTVVQEASRKGARLNRKHAMGWEEIVQNTNDVIVEESSRIISDINQITDAMREIKKTTNYTTNSDKETPLSIEPVEGASPNVHTHPRSILGIKRKKVTTSKRHTPKRARVDISDESEGAQEAAHKAIDDLLEAANDFSMAHNDGIGNDTPPLAVQKGNKLEMSAAEGGTQKELMCLGMQLVRTPAPNQLVAGSTSRTSPVSLHRQMCAVELDIREEIEEGAINLNVNLSQGAFSTQRQPKRIVKPGKYARSPFVMGYDPPTRAPANVMQIYRLFYRENTNKLKDMWIISQNPKYMDISGQQLRYMLRDSGEVDNVLITLTMRRYQQMDIAREDYISMLRYIKDMFVGPHITYEVNKCTEIVLLVKFDFKWSTYIWDFPKANIFVLDPTMNNGDESDKEIQLRHWKVADELHKAIELCIKSFFAGWEPDMRLWNTCFPKSLVTGICKKGGPNKTNIIVHGDGVMHARMNLLVDLLGTEGNIGHLPKRYQDCLFPKKDKQMN